MTRNEAYACGLFEGEGYVGRPSDGRPPRLRVNMADREPLDRLAATVGGVVRGPYARSNPNHRPMYTWELNGWEAVERLFALWRDELSPRRVRQFQRALAGAPSDDCRGLGWRNRTKTHCKRGHPFDEANTRVNKGSRECRKCHREHKRRYRQAVRDAQ